MELLDMVPADAIALRLYSLPAAVAAAASLYYAWLVAALAAAVGLWRIRAVSTGVRGSAIVDDGNSKAQSPSPSPAIEEPRLAAPAAEPAEAASPSTPSKVRFTAYYGGSGDANDGVVDGVRRCADEDDDDDGEAETTTVLRRTASAPERRRAKALAAAAAPWEEREMAVRRRGDLGWYRHLDMAALDGSVVKLWDGELTASPRGRRRAGLELQLSF